MAKRTMSTLQKHTECYFRHAARINSGCTEAQRWHSWTMLDQITRNAPSLRLADRASVVGLAQDTDFNATIIQLKRA